MIAPELATWAVGPLEVPAAVDRAALRHMLDGLGTAIAGMRLAAATPAITVARDLGGPAEAAILGSTDRVGAPAAALANGTLVHALDFDDTHAGGLVHATAVVLPAALAIGEQTGATGRQVLDGAIVGYEIACRVAAAAPYAFHAGGLHATMVAGVFSSAAITARLLGLDAERATHALGIAGSQAGGLLAFLGTGASTKQLHPGFASHAGILAARLAAAGATGPETVFDGPHGVYQALAPVAVASGAVDPARILAGLGTDWETTRISLKPWPSCQLAHASMAAALAAVSSHDLNPERVRAVHARVHPDSAAVVCAPDRDLARPASGYAAKFSLPWSVAAAILDGQVGIDSYSPMSLARPEVAQLAGRVTWSLAPAAGPAADAPGEVELTLDDGRTVTGRVTRSPGGGANPLSDAEVTAKFTANVGDGADHLAVALLDLPQAPDLTALIGAAALPQDHQSGRQPGEEHPR